MMNTMRELYRQKGLTKEEQQYLIDSGYVHVVSGPILGVGTANYYVRGKPTTQGASHFVLTRLIEEAAIALGLNPIVNDYGHDCDVSVSQADGKTYGFEVETGSNNKRDLKSKVKRLDAACTSRAHDWFFVVPSKHMKRYKRYHQQTILRGKVMSTLEILSRVAKSERNLYCHMKGPAILGQSCLEI